MFATMHIPFFPAVAALAAILASPVHATAAVGEGAGACHLHIAWNEAPPYQTADRDGKPSGIDVELMTEAAKRMPCTLDWELAPRARAFAMLQEGRVDMLIGVGRTSEREAFGVFSQPVRDGRNVLIVRKGHGADFAFKNLTELSASSFRLGVIAGSRYSQEFEDLTRNGDLADNTITAPNGDSAMAMLMRDRIDGFIDGYRIAINRALQLGLAGQIEIYPMFVNEQQAFALFSRASGVDPATITRFNTAIMGMQMDGTVARILHNDGS